MPFFEFNQNNSGGSFAYDADAGITHHVIIEADDARHANYLAERIGLYFDGSGDCECCGSRWYEQWEDDKGDPVPSIYGTPISEYDFSGGWMGSDPEAYVHFKDGPFQGYGFETKILTD
ncbi:hypothetical protein SEA_NABI_66 [Streptomyces phage Nabi]|nr:hypothetical protein SEA_NABI_66 [Streptomyces phage Nabi]